MKPSSQSRVTLADVAELAGLSPAAVSSVMNGRAKERRIGQKSVERVEAAIRQLGYVPNIAARRLRATAPGTSQAVLAVVTAAEAPLLLVSRAVQALQELVDSLAGGTTRYTVSIELFHAGRLAELPGVSDRHHFSAAIIANTIPVDDEFLAANRIPYPVVLLGRRVAGYPSVMESSATGREAAGLLIDSGCRDCAVLYPALGTAALGNRVHEFAETISRRGGGQMLSILCADRSEEAGYDAMKRHLAGSAVADGFFAVNDTIAIGACRAILESGRRIPEDVCIVGVGDHPVSAFLTPSLTCVGSSETEMHRAAARLLLELVEGRSPARMHVEVPLSKTIRESTRAG